MAWISLWPTRITEFLHAVQIVAIVLEFSMVVEVKYFNSLFSFYKESETNKQYQTKKKNQTTQKNQGLKLS